MHGSSETFAHKRVTSHNRTQLTRLVSHIGLIAYIFSVFECSHLQINLSGPYFRSLSNRNRGPITPSTPPPCLAECRTELDSAGRHDGDEETFLLMQQSHEGDDNLLANLKSNNRRNHATSPFFPRIVRPSFAVAPFFQSEGVVCDHPLFGK